MSILYDITEILLKVALNTIKQTNSVKEYTMGIPAMIGSSRFYGFIEDWNVIKLQRRKPNNFSSRDSFRA